MVNKLKLIQKYLKEFLKLDKNFWKFSEIIAKIWHHFKNVKHSFKLFWKYIPKIKTFEKFLKKLKKIWKTLIKNCFEIFEIMKLFCKILITINLNNICK